MRKSLVWIASLFLLFAAQGALAATYTFTGSVDGDWNNVSNWDFGVLPGSSDDVILAANVSSNTGIDPVINTITVGSGYGLNITQITLLSGGTFNSGSYNASTIYGNPIFNSSSSTGAIIGNPIFNSSLSDFATITGNPIFNGNSEVYEIIIGNATFNDTSRNLASITGNATFNDCSTNNGTVTGTIISGSCVVTFTGAAGDHDWNNVANWDLGFVPRSTDDVVIEGEVIGTSGPPITIHNLTSLSDFSADVTVTGVAIFNESSRLNNGSITGNAIFNGDSYNYNVVSGNVTFNDRSSNQGTVTGNADFNDSSSNHATVQGNGFFSCDATNLGSVVGTINSQTGCDDIVYFYNTSGVDFDWNNISNWFTDPLHVNQALLIPSATNPIQIIGTYAPNFPVFVSSLPTNITINTPSISFHGPYTVNPFESLNFSTTTAHFYDMSYGGSLTGNATFHGQATLSSSGHVSGTAEFSDFSSNSGSVISNAIYHNAVAGVITIPSGGTWGCGTSAANLSTDGTTSINSWIFQGTGGTGCHVLGNLQVNGSRYNTAIVTGNAIFNDSSYNSTSGVVQGDATWNSDKFGTIPTGNTLTIDQNDWSGIINGTIFASNGTTPITNFVFNNTTSTLPSGTNIKAHVTLNGTSYLKNTPVTGNVTYNTSYFGPLPLNGTMTVNTGASYDQNKFTHGVVSGTTYGSDSLPITHYIFNNSSGLSQAATITGSAEFNDSTFHLGTINGNVTFNDTSTSAYSFVNGDAIFRECSVNISTSVSGTAQDLRSCGGSSSGGFPSQSDFSLPIISDFSLSPSTNSILITFNTNEPTKNIFTFIDFTLSNTGLNPFINLPESTQKMQHSVTLSNLKSCTTYKYYFVVKDVVGNTTRYGDGNDKLFTTLGCPNDPVQPLVEPPVKPEPNITSLTATPTVSDSTISFSTPTPTTAVITYGTTTDYGTTTTTHPFGTSHIFLLTPLDACTTYHYVIGTKDADDVVTTSADHTFKTLGCPVGDVDEPAQEEKELPPVVNPPVVQGEDGPADNNGENNNNNDAVIVGGGNVGRGGGVAAGGNSGAGNNFVKAPDAGADLVVLLESVVQPLSPDSPPDISPFAVSSSLASSIVPGNTNGASDLGDKGTSDTSTSSVAGETVKFFNSVKHSVQKNTRQTLVNTLGEKNTEVLSKTIAKTVEETVVVSKYTLIGASALLAVLFIALNIMLFQGLWTTYLVERGETIASLCNKFSMSEETLRKKNPHLFETTTNLDGTLSTPLTSESLVPEGISLKVRNRHYIERDYLNQLQYVLKNFMESRKSELVS